MREPDVATRDLGTLEEIATRLGGRLEGPSSSTARNVRITGVAAIGEVHEGELTFATDAKYLRAALESKASAVLTEADGLRTLGHEPEKTVIVVDSAREALAQLLRMFAPAREKGTHIHPSAVIDATASIGPDAHVGPNAVVGAGAKVGARATLCANCVVGNGAQIGDDALLGPGSAFLDRCVAGDRLVLQPGAVVGSDGFGYVLSDGRWVKIPQVGTVVLGDDVEVGANSCIDRAQTGATRIGDGTKIDNLVQIGHNCRIGKSVAIAGLAGLSGSSNVGDGTRIGGMTGTRGHLTIGSQVTIAGNSMIWGDIPDGAFVSGQPAQDHRAELRWQASLRKVPNLIERVNALERKSS